VGQKEQGSAMNMALLDLKFKPEKKGGGSSGMWGFKTLPQQRKNNDWLGSKKSFHEYT